MSEHIININKELCIGCGACVSDCVDSNIVVENSKAKPIKNDCLQCGHCVAVCPKGAVSISGYEDKIIEKPDFNLDPDAVFNSIKFTRTVRQFKSDKIPQDLIEKIVEAGRIAHTAENSQNVGIRVISDSINEAEKTAVSFFRNGKKVADIFSHKINQKMIKDDFFFFGAPLAIVVTSKTGVPFSDVNATLAAANMEFVAEANGLGVLHSGFFSICVNIIPGLRKMLKIPVSRKAVTTLVIGYPKVKYFRSVNRKNGDVKFL